MNDIIQKLEEAQSRVKKSDEKWLQIEIAKTAITTTIELIELINKGELEEALKVAFEAKKNQAAVKIDWAFNSFPDGGVYSDLDGEEVIIKNKGQ